MQVDRLVLLPMPVDLYSERGDVLAGVRFTGDRQWSFAELREQGQELLQRCVQVLADLKK